MLVTPVQMNEMTMNIQQQLNLHGSLDPFTLLKVSKAFGEIACGNCLEIMYTGDQIPNELFKVLPAAQYRIVEMDRSENSRRCRIVFRKIGTTSPDSDFSEGGCRCI